MARVFFNSSTPYNNTILNPRSESLDIIATPPLHSITQYERQVRIAILPQHRQNPRQEFLDIISPPPYSLHTYCWSEYLEIISTPPSGPLWAPSYPLPKNGSVFPSPNSPLENGSVLTSPNSRLENGSVLNPFFVP